MTRVDAVEASLATTASHHSRASPDSLHDDRRSSSLEDRGRRDDGGSYTLKYPDQIAADTMGPSLPKALPRSSAVPSQQLVKTDQLQGVSYPVNGITMSQHMEVAYQPLQMHASSLDEQNGKLAKINDAQHPFDTHHANKSPRPSSSCAQPSSLNETNAHMFHTDHMRYMRVNSRYVPTPGEFATLVNRYPSDYNNNFWATIYSEKGKKRPLDVELHSSSTKHPAQKKVKPSSNGHEPPVPEFQTLGNPSAISASNPPSKLTKGGSHDTVSKRTRNSPQAIPSVVEVPCTGTKQTEQTGPGCMQQDSRLAEKWIEANYEKHNVGWIKLEGGEGGPVYIPWDEERCCTSSWNGIKAMELRGIHFGTLAKAAGQGIMTAAPN